MPPQTDQTGTFVWLRIGCEPGRAGCTSPEGIICPQWDASTHRCPFGAPETSYSEAADMCEPTGRLDACLSAEVADSTLAGPVQTRQGACGCGLCKWGGREWSSEEIHGEGYTKSSGMAGEMCLDFDLKWCPQCGWHLGPGGVASSPGGGRAGDAEGGGGHQATSRSHP
jgi:hypothetical protein